MPFIIYFLHDCEVSTSAATGNSNASIISDLGWYLYRLRMGEMSSTGHRNFVRVRPAPQFCPNDGRMCRVVSLVHLGGLTPYRWTISVRDLSLANRLLALIERTNTMLSTSGPGVVRVGESPLFVANGRNTNEQDHRQADFRFHQVPLPPLRYARRVRPGFLV